ncbi:hypothetical protein EYF80_057520 [Liparis tanakae]|uniref:Uncharacterized protein n=1 Tax=Liparis tanakae TaxID=230148 RepID=A0A4Z2EU02_9TELE|nr:hypothetical protein EYF80_057520 [Liparis tanakae]
MHLARLNDVTCASPGIHVDTVEKRFVFACRCLTEGWIRTRSSSPPRKLLNAPHCSERMAEESDRRRGTEAGGTETEAGGTGSSLRTETEAGGTGTGGTGSSLRTETEAGGTGSRTETEAGGTGSRTETEAGGTGTGGTGSSPQPESGAGAQPVSKRQRKKLLKEQKWEAERELRK